MDAEAGRTGRTGRAEMTEMADCSLWFVVLRCVVFIINIYLYQFYR